jgi:hypothetical protein
MPLQMSGGLLVLGWNNLLETASTRSHPKTRAKIRSRDFVVSFSAEKRATKITCA